MGRYARTHRALSFQTSFFGAAYNRFVATSARRIGSFTVVVPSYNEAAALCANIEAVRQYLIERSGDGRSWTILVVDDASTDETPNVASALALADDRVRVLCRASNGGVDVAVRDGLAAVKGDAIVVLDADLSYSPSIVGSLLDALAREDADVAVASAYAPGGSVHNVPRRRASLSKWANRLLSYAAHERVHTFTCIVRAYRADVARTLMAYRRDGDAAHQMLLDALRLQMRVVEIPTKLEWSKTRRSRMRLAETLRRTQSVLGVAIHERPSLALVIPGLLPGMLPLAIALSILAHGTTTEVAIVGSTTFAVQTASLIVFGFHSTNFALRTWMRRGNARRVVRNNT